jgi:hypothetical protein
VSTYRRGQVEYLVSVGADVNDESVWHILVRPAACPAVPSTQSVLKYRGSPAVPRLSREAPSLRGGSADRSHRRMCSSMRVRLLTKSSEERRRIHALPRALPPPAHSFAGPSERKNATVARAAEASVEASTARCNPAPARGWPN